MEPNTLYYGDNLVWLRDHDHFPNASVDLIYLDPPFNSNQDYNVIFTEPGDKSPSQAQMRTFDDTWSWDRHESEKALAELGNKQGGPGIVELIQWVARRGDRESRSTAAYLSMMSVRLIELWRVLKPTGSLYLHCDPTASHYLKIILDTLFGPKAFRSEIIWRRSNAHNKLSRQYGPIHDVILFYGKSDEVIFRPGRRPYGKEYIKSSFPYEDGHGRFQSNVLTGPGMRYGDSGKPWRDYDPTKKGRHWAIPGKLMELLSPKSDKLTVQEILDLLDKKGMILPPKQEGGLPRYKQYLDSSEGVLYQDIWAFQPGTRGLLLGTEDGIDEDVKWLDSEEERVGYQTQKPLGLLERIIETSSDKGEVVLDPFCGCGTAVVAAQKLGRRWIGIDVTWVAIDLVGKRLSESFGPKIKSTYRVLGNPYDEASAKALAAKNKKEFELWAISLVGAVGRETDGGVDGLLSIPEGKDVNTKVIVQVKGGAINPGFVRDLLGTVEKERAAIGLFITLLSPTAGMQEVAVHSGSYRSPIWATDYQKLQIRTVKELLDGNTFDLPVGYSPVRKSPRAKSEKATTEPLGL